jgi:multidrug efflux pump subunit AcrA (membrane-fusion protein)
MIRRGAVAGAIAAVAIAAAAAVVFGVLQPAPTVPVIRVSSEAFRVRVFADGTLASVRSTPVTAPIKPQIPFTLSWLVDDGAVVEEGDIIARFDASRLEKDHEDGVSDQRISDHRIDSAKTSREVTVGKLDRDEEVAQHELEVAREFQSTDTTIYSKIEIAESQIDTELAETRAEHAIESQEIQDRLSQAEIDLLGIERRKADIKVQQAQEGLAALEVRSPRDGIVVLERDWRGNAVRVGDMIWPGRPLGEIPDLTEMQAEVFVLEADAGDLAEGQPATVWIESTPNIAFQAVLESVDPMAGRKNRRVPVQYFRTVLALDHTDVSLMKYGARVRAEITIADFESCITVPRQAVTTIDGESVVHRWSRRGFASVPVELGPTALGRTVVVSGLEDGDRIALRDPTTDAEESPEAEGSSSSPMITGGGG